MANDNQNHYTLSELKEILFEIDYTTAINYLKDENTHDFLKIFSIINIEKIKNNNDAKIFINHLTQHSNPIREAIAIKLEEIFDENFYDEFCIKKILDGVIDINPNVCRCMCNLIRNNQYLKENLENKIIFNIQNIIEGIKKYEQNNKDFFDNKNKNTKNHKKNKLLFALYWLLEALFCAYSKKYNSETLEILKYTINFTDFTIREKTAQLLQKTDNIPFEMLQKAKSDENFYVKSLCKKIDL